MAPLIAIGRCSKLPDYEKAVAHAGGEPWVIDASVSADDVLCKASGILLAGGGDVDPSLYGEAAHPTFSASEPGRDAFEIELVRRATDADLPMLAICRGIQVLNVARGGSLVQDIPSQMGTSIRHKLEVPPHEAIELAHEIWMEKDSLLVHLIGESGSDTAEVNSRHHQAVRNLGPGLATTATAPDGVIEAIEDSSRRFCLGVQWHPENFYRTGEFRSLFEGFIRAADRTTPRL